MTGAGIARGRCIVLLAALGTLMFGMAVASPAQAHSALEETSPKNGALLTDAPSQVRLVFNEDLTARFTFLALTVRGKPTSLKPRVRGGTVTATVPAALRDAARPEASTWTLGYRVVSADGHPINGTVKFNVRANPTPAATPQTSSTPESSDGASAAPEDDRSDTAKAQDAREPSGISKAAVTIAWLTVGGAIALGLILWRRARR